MIFKLEIVTCFNLTPLIEPVYFEGSRAPRKEDALNAFNSLHKQRQNYPSYLGEYNAAYELIKESVKFPFLEGGVVRSHVFVGSGGDTRITLSKIDSFKSE